MDLLRRLKETNTELSMKPVSLGIAVQLHSPKAGGFVSMLIRDGETPNFNPGLNKIEQELARQQTYEAPLAKRVISSRK